MVHFWKILVLATILVQCTIDRTVPPINEEELATLEIFEELPANHQVRLGQPNEPGETLSLCITLKSRETGFPLKNSEIQLYQAAADGSYYPSKASDESTARINGRVRTDSLGRVFVRTILPGDYGSSGDNRHIHTTVPDARPQAYDIHFKQFCGFMLTNFVKESDQHFLADLRQSEDGTLVGILKMQVKNTSQ